MKLHTKILTIAALALVPASFAAADNNGLGSLVVSGVNDARDLGYTFGSLVSHVSKQTNSGMADGDEPDVEPCGNGCSDPGVGNVGRYSTTNNGNESGTPRSHD